jgi:2',3'-cyclic-nucleotide 2'-phosphodiesterase (5'-nucleotidase family)
MKLKVLHVNDIHSRFEELARIASVIEELRDKNTVVLDAGDNADFARLETEGTHGRISSAILDKMGFTARAFGNNEGFAGLPNTRALAETSLTPVITCNMYDLKGGKLDFLKDALDLNIAGVRILIIGVTGSVNVFYHLFGIHVKEPEEEIRRVLAEKTSHDLVIVLSHLGLNADRKLASGNPDIDVIIGGHSHTLLKQPLKENQTIICQAGQLGEYLGELAIDYDTADKRVRSFRGRVISSKRYPQHPEIMKLIKKYSRQADRNLSVKLYAIDTPLGHSLTEENPIGNLLADALKDMMKTELGLINSGVLNSGVKKGIVTKKLLHALCPSPLNPTYIEIKGVDIHDALEESLSKERQLSDGRGAGFRGQHPGNVQVSGNVRVRLRKNAEGELEIESITVGGKPLDSERWYTVATSDYLQRGSGYHTLAHNRNEKYRVEFLRDVLEEYLAKKSFVESAFTRRFTIDVDARKQKLCLE